MAQSILTRGFTTETIVLESGESIDVYPAPGSLGIPIGINILAVFDREMDLSSINSGTFFLSAPDSADVFGPSLESIENIGQTLSSSNYIQASIEFYKANEDGELIEEVIEDTTGDGTLWRTIAVLVPDQILNPNLEYTVTIAGDENTADAFSSGVRTRTVFDPIVTKTGTGRAFFSGGYTGSNNRTYNLRIIESGSTGTAIYEWWESSSPLVVKSGITTTGSRHLENGIYVNFGPDGTFNVGDLWTVVIRPFESFGSTASWKFTTGSGAVVLPPSTSSATGIKEILTVNPSNYFPISNIEPAMAQYGVEIESSPYDGNRIVVTFETLVEIDETTLNGAISLVSDSATGDPRFPFTGDLEFDYSLSSNVLTIEIYPGQLYPNNIVILTLDKSIANLDGYTLEENFVSYFSTTYTPLYTTYRRIMLDLGQLLSNVEEETIMLAILEASTEADDLTFGTIHNQQYFQYARKQYTTCLAELMLTKGLLSGGAGDRLTKKLADLSISRDGKYLSTLANDLKECVKEWEIVIETGGLISQYSSLPPEIAVKGSTAYDAISIGRLWEPTTGVGRSTPGANADVYRSPRRTNRSWRNKT